VDFKENHSREVSRCLIQDIADAMAAALAKEKEWSYALPKFDEPSATVAISLDGTCTLMGEDGWRGAMVGTLASYDSEGERQHTIDLAATPEYGRAKFLDHLEFWTKVDRWAAPYRRTSSVWPRSTSIPGRTPPGAPSRLNDGDLTLSRVSTRRVRQPARGWRASVRHHLGRSHRRAQAG
jgi:hypothetical protein